jgi:Fe-S-cluster containining protein
MESSIPGKTMCAIQTECRQCGTCCQKGGPALHVKDLERIRSGKISVNRLITIRKGELAYNPLTDRVQAVAYELVKISGIGRDWGCFYYKIGQGCTIYKWRPLACQILRCWDPDEISALVGKDLLTRMDIMAVGDPLRLLVEEHERLCPCPDMEFIRDSLSSGCLNYLNDLQKLVDRDLIFRHQVMQERNISLAQELFYFGRPIFQLLQAVGIRITETNKGVRLSLRLS